MADKTKKQSVVNRVIQVAFESYCKLLTMINPELNSRVRYKHVFGVPLDLKNPKTLNEKILWLKLKDYQYNPLVTKCADKIAVRDYIKECGCEELLIDLVGAYMVEDGKIDIPWDELPDSFALKYNTGCAMNMICTDKSDFNIEVAKGTIDKWIHSKYWLTYSEMQYKNIKPGIIVEKLIQDKQTDDGKWIAPLDYKIYCYHGVPKYVMVCSDRGTAIGTRYWIFDRDWNLQIFTRAAVKEPTFTMDKPQKLDEMFEYAVKLSKPFPFVRVDLYYSNDKIYFGELTFTPCGGIDYEYTDEELKEACIRLGEPIEING